jgi:hypothetical protein
MRSPTSLHEIVCTAKRNFDHECKKTFATKSAATGLMQRSKKTLFDHLVGDGEQRGRDGEAERLSDLKVDHQLELG